MKLEDQVCSLELAKKLKELGEFTKAKMFRAADVINILRKNGWKWTTGTKDVYLFKGISSFIKSVVGMRPISTNIPVTGICFSTPINIYI